MLQLVDAGKLRLEQRGQRFASFPTSPSRFVMPAVMAFVRFRPPAAVDEAAVSFEMEQGVALSV